MVFLKSMIAYSTLIILHCDSSYYQVVIMFPWFDSIGYNVKGFWVKENCFVYLKIFAQAFIQTADTYAVFSPMSMGGDDDFRESCSWAISS